MALVNFYATCVLALFLKKTVEVRTKENNTRLCHFSTQMSEGYHPFASVLTRGEGKHMKQSYYYALGLPLCQSNTGSPI